MGKLSEYIESIKIKNPDGTDKVDEDGNVQYELLNPVYVGLATIPEEFRFVGPIYDNRQTTYVYTIRY